MVRVVGTEELGSKAVRGPFAGLATEVGREVELRERIVMFRELVEAGGIDPTGGVSFVERHLWW